MSEADRRASLLITEPELRGVLPIAKANEVVRQAFVDWSEQPVLNAVRQRMHARSGMRVTVHPGISPSASAGGVLIHVEVVDAASSTQVYDTMSPPVAVVYNSDNGRLEALVVGAVSCAELPDIHSFTSVRTAATSVAGTFSMARPDASVLGILGTGNQARTHLVAFLAAHSFDRVIAHSRTDDNRRRFGVEMSEVTGMKVEITNNTEAVIDEADIILTATNSNVPVFDGTLLRPGQHVTSIVGSNRGLVATGRVSAGRRELDDATLIGANRIGIVSKAQAIHDQQADIYDQVVAGDLSWDDIVELTDLVSGTPGRDNASDITVFKNNAGMGIADLAVAGAAFQAVVAHGGGTEFFPN
jgi:ornithine cyclodeaminase/alanine dehydrogenase-like protein (mu-crystallin family)